MSDKRTQLKEEFVKLLMDNGIKSISAGTYANSALRMVEEVYGFDKFETKNLSTDYDKLEEYILNLPTAASKQSGIAQGTFRLVTAIPDIDPRIKEQYERLLKNVKEKETLQRLERQWSFDEEPEILWGRIKERIEKLPQIKGEDVKTTNDLRKYMSRYLGLLYTLHPPIRHSEWISAIFSDKDDGHTNHVNLEKGELVIYEQKSSHFGVRRNRLSPVLVESMKDMHKLMGKLYTKRDKEYVLPKYETGYGQPESATVSEKIDRVLGYNLNSIRKIYEGVVYKNGHPDTYQYVVNALGHSVDTSRKDYIKNLKRDKIKWPVSGDHFSILEEFMHSGQKINKPVTPMVAKPIKTPLLIRPVQIKPILPLIKNLSTGCNGHNKSGQPCGSPTKKGETYCYHHKLKELQHITTESK